MCKEFMAMVTAFFTLWCLYYAYDLHDHTHFWQALPFWLSIVSFPDPGAPLRRKSGSGTIQAISGACWLSSSDGAPIRYMPCDLITCWTRIPWTAHEAPSLRSLSSDVPRSSRRCICCITTTMLSTSIFCVQVSTMTSLIHVTSWVCKPQKLLELYQTNHFLLRGWDLGMRLAINSWSYLVLDSSIDTA